MSSDAPKYDSQVGDLVICVDNDACTSLTRGKAYRVEGINIPRNHIQIIGDRGYPINRFATRFKPAPPPEVITSDDQEYHEVLKAQEIYEDATK